MEPLELVTAGDLSIWALFWQAGWVVKIVMIGLLVASVWTWAIIVDKVIAYGRMRSALNRFEKVFWSGHSLEDLYRTLSARPATSMAAMFVAAMREWQRSQERTQRLRDRREGRAQRRQGSNLKGPAKFSLNQ